MSGWDHPPCGALLLNIWGGKWYPGTWRNSPSGWLRVCVQYAAAVSFHLLSSEKLLAGGIVRKCFHWCHVGSFFLGSCILFFSRSVWGILILNLVNGFNFPYIALSDKNVDWLEGDALLEPRETALQAVLDLLMKQWLYKTQMPPTETPSDHICKWWNVSAFCHPLDKSEVEILNLSLFFLSSLLLLISDI